MWNLYVEKCKNLQFIYILIVMHKTAKNHLVTNVSVLPSNIIFLSFSLLLKNFLKIDHVTACLLSSNLVSTCCVRVCKITSE